MNEYPKWKYGVTDVIVETKEEEDGLSGKWYDTPTARDDARSASLQSDHDANTLAATDLATLKKTADDLGVTYDGRWGAEKIEAAIKAKIEADGNPAADDDAGTTTTAPETAPIVQG